MVEISGFRMGPSEEDFADTVCQTILPKPGASAGIWRAGYRNGIQETENRLIATFQETISYLSKTTVFARGGIIE